MTIINKIILGIVSAMFFSTAVAEPVEKSNIENIEIKIYIVRHGKTMFNTLHRVQGWSDSPLTEKGKKDAYMVANGLSTIKFDILYTSDLGRARETASIIKSKQHSNLAVIEDNRLKEWNYGGYEGGLDGELWTPIFKKWNLSYDKNFTQWDQLMSKATDRDIANEISQNDPMHWAENYQQIETRLHDSLEDIAKNAEKNGYKNVLVVSHGGAIGTIIDTLTPGKEAVPLIDNMSVTTLSYQGDGTFKLIKAGDMSYYQAH
ncbi:TPA: histidine phosphatase family protein [Kluyvera ascorbata]|nr:histidine phosphatase family protein [Kluyvera ascorbata]